MGQITQWGLVASCLMLAAMAGTGVPRWTASDKAFYLDENQVNFVRPGLALTITSAEILADGTIRAGFTLKDPRGLPLDREGITTPGTVAISFIAGVIPKGANLYTAYTTRTQTSPITGNSAIQAGTDAGGTYERLSEGVYRYTFRTKAPATIDRTAAHTIGAYSSRNLTEFDLGTQYSDTTFNFIPAGGDAPAVRDVVRTATCNNCHDPLSAHGGARQKVELCVMCHSPQTTDPDTGNTLDMTVMVHKIHMGKNLPSVIAGKPYRIIGFGQGVNDYSTVSSPSDVRQCQVCHKNETYLKPTRAACGACHDGVNFATGEGHVNLPQVSDNQCATCHIPQGELEFDASVIGAHMVPRLSTTLPGTVFELVRVDGAGAGKKPTVLFKISDRSGKEIPLSAMTRLNLVMSGPTSDYAAYVSEDARGATGGGDGIWSYTLGNTLPASASGTFSIGIEGYRNVTLLPGTTRQTVVRDAGHNQVIHFTVGGGAVVARRQIVSTENCNVCHTSLSLHGDNRNDVAQCILCHNPNETDRARRPATAGLPQSVDFKTLIHRIHAGEENTREYTVYGFGGVPFDFTEVRFPGDRRNCSTCHINGSEQLPLGPNLLPVLDPRGPVTPRGPETAACLGCHTSIPAASHALGNTTVIGEACSVCHGPNADFSVNRSHAR